MTNAPLIVDFDASVCSSDQHLVVTLALRQTKIRGTKNYFAPELQDGTIAPSWRTDVYALGATIDELTRREGYRTANSAWERLIGVMKGAQSSALHYEMLVACFEKSP
jgi:serine/threonine protein kinase